MLLPNWWLIVSVILGKQLSIIIKEKILTSLVYMEFVVFCYCIIEDMSYYTPYQCRIHVIYIVI